MTNNYYNFSYTPILNNEGKTHAIVVICRDVTDQIIANQRLKDSETRFRTQAEELETKNRQLVRTNNDLDNFIYTASHDLKAPISNVEGLVNALNKLLSLEGKNSAHINSLIEMIYISIARFKTTVNDLTEVAKVESIGEEAVTEVSFKEVFEEVKVNIDALIQGSSAVIIDDFNATPLICFPRKNLRSIIYNLLSNGIKYSSPERTPKIHITSSQPNNEEILLTVQDNGLGIKEEDKFKVFSMFKRLHNHVEGTGIGLAIVKKIVDNNGGRIEIESEVAKGSLFKIFLKV